jgi:hypothetical protein
MRDGRDKKDGPAEARRILQRVARESETIGSSNLARAASRPVREEEDLIERLGRRIGRTLGFLAAAALVVYLLANYFQPR